MNTITIDRGPTRPYAASRRSTVARVMILICLTVAMIGLSAPNASAISQYTAWEGRPGALVQSSRAVGHPSFAGLPAKVTMLNAHVRRSPATSGAQTVYYQYRLYSWTGSTWFRGSTASGVGTIPAGQNTAILTGSGYGGTVELPANTANGGYFAVELAVTFYSGGQYLGGFQVWHDQSGDYMCNRQVTLYGLCKVYSGGYMYLS
jgi:hypothetical protein